MTLAGNKLEWLCLILIGIVVLMTYQPTLATGLWADDYLFLERAGTLSFPEYMSQSFDIRYENPRFVHRPVFGVLMWVEYELFKANSSGYHWVSLLWHLVNGVLVFALVRQVTRNPRIGLIAALVFQGFPINAFPVLWVSDVSELQATAFYLLTLIVWMLYLQRENKQYYALSFVTLALAIFSKEIAITLPVTLFLFDRLIVRPRVNFATLLRRYTPLVLLVGLFLLQYSDLIFKVGASTTGGGASVLWLNAGKYLTTLVLPWLELPSENLVLLMAIVVWVAIFVFVFWKTRQPAIIFLGLELLVTILPALPFTFFSSRYMYLSTIVYAILVALLAEAVIRALNKRRLTPIVMSVSIAGMLIFHGSLVNAASADFAGLAWQTRAPFREIAQRHRTLPQDTLLYLVGSPVSARFLSGMFFLRYGAGITVQNAENGQIPRLREYPTAFVYNFDASGGVSEMRVDPNAVTLTKPALPANFAGIIDLERYAVTKTQLGYGENLGIILRWHLKQQTAKDYTAFIHLVDSQGQTVTGEDTLLQLNHQGTRQWKPGETVIDFHMIPMDSSIPPGDYQLQIGLYDLASLERLPVTRDNTSMFDDKITIEPFKLSAN